ncbi:MAG TPA: hypothetical protein VGB85_05930, partial [Nannocystis sp.]
MQAETASEQPTELTKGPAIGTQAIHDARALLLDSRCVLLHERSSIPLEALYTRKWFDGVTVSPYIHRVVHESGTG